DETPGEIVVGACLFGFGEQPFTKSLRSRTLSGKRPVPIYRAQHLHVLLAGLAPDGVADERIAGDAKLSPQEGGYRERDHFAWHQHPARMAQCAELQGEADPGFRPTPA